MANQSFHHEVALGLTQFYARLTETPYLSPDDIQHPPPGGWSDAELDVEGLRTTLGRSEAVVDLLRHLPYPRPVETGPHTGQWPIWPTTKAVRYLREQGSLLDENLEGLYELAHLPPDMASLTHPADDLRNTEFSDVEFENGYGPSWWLVDCKSGRIIQYAGHSRGGRGGGEFEAGWKNAGWYLPDGFFSDTIPELGATYYPVPGLVEGIEPELSTSNRRWELNAVYESCEIEKIYTQAGWNHPDGPGPDWDREKCRKYLIPYLQDREKRLFRKQKAQANREEAREHAPKHRDPAAYPAGYDRDVIVAGLTRYYETLAKMAFFPASLIQYPPGEGRCWGDDDGFLPEDKIRLLGFNDRVVDLLRHLPYLDVDEAAHGDERWPAVVGRGEPQRYLADNPTLNEDLTASDATPENLCATGLFPFPEKMPDGLVPIAGGCADGAPTGWWIVDTNAGTVIVYDSGWKQVQTAPDDQPWLWSLPQLAGPFFDELVDSLCALDLVPVPRPDTEVAEWYPEIWVAVQDEGSIEDCNEMSDPEILGACEIYRAHGWPDVAKFRRQECYDALVEYRTKRLLEEG
ncbi:sulfate transporter 4.1 [Apiospora arundinis]